MVVPKVHAALFAVALLTGCYENQVVGYPSLSPEEDAKLGPPIFEKEVEVDRRFMQLVPFALEAGRVYWIDVICDAREMDVFLVDAAGKQHIYESQAPSAIGPLAGHREIPWRPQVHVQVHHPGLRTNHYRRRVSLAPNEALWVVVDNSGFPEDGADAAEDALHAKIRIFPARPSP